MEYSAVLLGKKRKKEFYTLIIGDYGYPFEYNPKKEDHERFLERVTDEFSSELVRKIEGFPRIALRNGLMISGEGEEKRIEHLDDLAFERFSRRLFGKIKDKGKINLHPVKINF